MTTKANPIERVFRVDVKPKNGLLRKLVGNAGPSIERVLRLDGINDLYENAARRETPREFSDSILEQLEITYRVSADDLERIPRTGPCVVVANHPFGGIEGIIFASLLLKIRPDVKIMANFLLGRIEPMKDAFILVDPFEREGSAASNLKPLREAMRLVRDGGMLVVFPAGEVSHLQIKRRGIADPQWSDNVARIVRKAKCPVLPIFVKGNNGALFQILGFVHARLRTAMLPREVLNKRGQRIDLRVGSPMPYRKMESIACEKELTEYLRQRTYMLSHRGLIGGSRSGSTKGGRLGGQATPTQCPIHPPVDPEALAREIENLPPSAVLLKSDDYDVVCARTEQIPDILTEIGRLRELTFRATGEGTGEAIDLDAFDQTYHHLFVWQRVKREIVGAYRLGMTDVLLKNHGKAGLYTSTLFNYKAKMLNELGPAIEMGRSFVRAEYQRSFQPLLLLWKGIGRYMSANPQYRVLFGPVSISNTYQSISRQLMVQFLAINHGLRAYQRLVSPRNPFPVKKIAGFNARTVGMLLKDEDDVSDFVSEVEPDQKGIPVLLRQYLKMGAKMLAFNLDHEFSDVVDALMLMDMTRTQPKLLERYMGKEDAQRYLSYHKVLAV